MKCPKCGKVVNKGRKGPFNPKPPCNVISCLCGYRFDISLYRRLEALEAKLNND